MDYRLHLIISQRNKLAPRSSQTIREQVRERTMTRCHGKLCFCHSRRIWNQRLYLSASTRKKWITQGTCNSRKIPSEKARRFHMVPHSQLNRLLSGRGPSKLLQYEPFQFWGQTSLSCGQTVLLHTLFMNIFIAWCFINNSDMRFSSPLLCYRQHNLVWKQHYISCFDYLEGSLISSLILTCCGP